jgi:hypothetical protein
MVLAIVVQTAKVLKKDGIGVNLLKRKNRVLIVEII